MCLIDTFCQLRQGGLPCRSLLTPCQDFKIRSNNRVRPIARPHHTFDSTKYIGGEVDIVTKATEEVDEKSYSEEDDVSAPITNFGHVIPEDTELSWKCGVINQSIDSLKFKPQTAYNCLDLYPRDALTILPYITEERIKKHYLQAVIQEENISTSATFSDCYASTGIITAYDRDTHDVEYDPRMYGVYQLGSYTLDTDNNLTNEATFNLISSNPWNYQSKTCFIKIDEGLPLGFSDEKKRALPLDFGFLQDDIHDYNKENYYLSLNDYLFQIDARDFGYYNETTGGEDAAARNDARYFRFKFLAEFLRTY